MCLVNRFGHGISENCSTNLFLPVQIYVTPNFDQATQNSADLEVNFTAKFISIFLRNENKVN